LCPAQRPVNMSYGLTLPRASGIVCIGFLGGGSAFFLRSQPDDIITDIGSRPIIPLCFSTGLVSAHI